jgi:hypothetical protein
MPRHHAQSQPPRLPEPPAQNATDTAWTYGAALFTFVLREGVTATLSDEQIDLALHASLYAVSGYDREPEPATARALDGIQHARAILAGVSRSRAAQEPEPAQDDHSAGSNGQRPLGGQRSPLIPPTPPRPPQPSAVDPYAVPDSELF